MSPVQLVKDLFGKAHQETDTWVEELWSVDAVDSLMKSLHIGNYEFCFEPKVVELSDIEDLYKIMTYAGKTALSESCAMSVAKRKRKICLHTGGWQFEAEDRRH